MEVIQQTPEQVQSKPQASEPEKQQAPQEDIVSRVSKYKSESPSTEQQDASFFNRNDIEKIKDPEARKYAEDAYKEMERGLNKKFQEVAEIRKKYGGSANQPWTPERLQAELKKQDFVSSAQYLNSQVFESNQSDGQVVPQCGMSTLDDMKKRLIKHGDYYDYKDEEHDIVLGFTYANGKRMWRISQLAFKGELNTEVYRKVHDGIVAFMKQRELDKIYAVVPKLPPDNIMRKFYDKIEDSTYWKIVKEKDGSWTLPLGGEVPITAKEIK